MEKKKVKKIGILYCGYNQIANVRSTLSFWNEIQIDGIEFVVCSISIPFFEYQKLEPFDDGTVGWIESLERKNLKQVITSPKFLRESGARTLALNFLVDNGVDIVWQVDSDEHYTRENVVRILSYILSTGRPSYSVNFKNYIFDGKHYLDDFCVPKINVVLSGVEMFFYNDNGIYYNELGVPDEHKIPREIAWVKHLSWLHEGGKRKVEYQKLHFGECSYRWNEEKQELEIDLDYYRRHNYTVPNILKDG